VDPEASGVTTQLEPTDGTRLDSWKEIAAYLKRDVTTVRRWEKREALPVHRHLHQRRDSVYAFTAEVDAWWTARQNGLGDHGVAPVEAAGDAARSAPDARGSRIAWAIAAIAGAAAIALAVLVAWMSADRSAGAERRLSILAPPGSSFDDIALSPDGRHLAFTATSIGAAGPAVLYVRPLDSLAATPLPDTDGAAFPFWSPHGDAIGFFAAGRLWTIRLDGSGPRSIANAPRARGGTWNRDGTIVFAPDAQGPLYRVASTGGEPAAVTSLRDGETGHVWPEFLPDGKRVLYLADTSSTRVDDHHVFVGSLDAAEPRRILSAASSVAYRDGHLLYELERHLLAQPFDSSTLALDGEAVRLAERIQQQPGVNHKAKFSVAGNILTFQAMQSPASRLVWHDGARPLSAALGAAAEYYDPTLSPDEQRLAFSVFDPELSPRFGYGKGFRSDLFVVDLVDGATAEPSRITSDPGAEWGPVWAPDGRSLVFSSNRRGPLELFLKDVSDPAKPDVHLETRGNNPVAQSWSPDGAFIIYAAFDPETGGDLWLLPTSGDRTPRPLLRSAFTEEQGQISPDGRRIAHTSNESGREEVYVQSFPGLTSKRRVSTAGGGDPRWSRDGTRLFYLAPTRHLMAVPVDAGAVVTAGPAVAVLETNVTPHWYAARNLYDVTRDGRVLMTTPVEDDRALPLTVVLDWALRLASPASR
jgi:Tol biopolymer transport system component